MADNLGVWKSDPTSTLKAACTQAAAMFLGSTAFGVCLALFYFAYPRFDLVVSEALFLPPHRFIGCESLLFHSLRYGFEMLFCLVCVLTGIGCVFSLAMRRRWLGLLPRQWLYLAICFLIGPLTVVNLGFKDHWGRPRPSTVTEFGGYKAYTPPLNPSDQCARNCSFVSGEASSIYIVGFAAAFLFPSAWGIWTVVAIIAGTFAGFVRMAEGGHFLSDVLFAGVLMALTASALQMLFIAIARDSRGAD